MPTGCCVPLCTNQVGGYTFSCNSEVKKKWLQQIKRRCKDQETGKLINWVPTKHSVVCPDHFTQSDYRNSPPGSIGKLSEDIIARIQEINDFLSRKIIIIMII